MKTNSTSTLNINTSNNFSKNFNTQKYFSLFLWLVALHSFFVGVGLIILPDFMIEFFKFNSVTERFFPTQGGVFHIIMAVCYAMAASDLYKYKVLILFTIIVKLLAALFLFSYFIFGMANLLVLMSGLTDFAMGVIIYYFYQKLFTQKSSALK